MDYPEDKTFKWHETFDFQAQLENDNYHINLGSGLVSRKDSILWDTPWDHVNQDTEKFCVSYVFLFNARKFIPSYCMNCWKVVVKPRTLRELFQLRNMQRGMTEVDPFVYCKCGVETRFYTPGLYGGYFYTRSYEEGMERYNQVRTLVNLEISPDVPVILKRYCTEFEKELGDSANYKRPTNADAIEDFFWQMMEPKTDNKKQPAIFKEHVYHSWIIFGWSLGTPEDRRQIELDWNNGNPLYLIPRTYHQKGE